MLRIAWTVKNGTSNTEKIHDETTKFIQNKTKINKRSASTVKKYFCIIFSFLCYFWFVSHGHKSTKCIKSAHNIDFMNIYLYAHGRAMLFGMGINRLFRLLCKNVAYLSIAQCFYFVSSFLCSILCDWFNEQKLSG